MVFDLKWLPHWPSDTVQNLKPEYVVVKRVGRNRNPLLIVELKRPSRWTTAGRRMVMRELLEYAESRFSLTQYGTIYLLGGIGLHWKVWKMEKTGSDEPTVVVDWQENISSNQSYGIFQTIAGSMYGINWRVGWASRRKRNYLDIFPPTHLQPALNFVITTLSVHTNLLSFFPFSQKRHLDNFNQNSKRPSVAVEVSPQDWLAQQWHWDSRGPTREIK